MTTTERSLILGSLTLVILVFLVGFAKQAPRPTHTIVLTAGNTASLALPITGVTAGALQKDLMALDAIKEEHSNPIYLTLNSPGGEVGAGLRMVETAQALHRPVHTITLFSASMSFILSQFLENRYTVSTGIMMSHPATVEGVRGTIPGTFEPLAKSIIEQLFQINSVIAIRSGRDLQEYNNLIANELWMQGQKAVEMGFADEVVSVRCDDTLQGAAEPRTMDMGGFSVTVVFHKCPLITDPLSAKMDGRAVSPNQLRKALGNVGGARINAL